jgi:hypothetical protein
MTQYVGKVEGDDGSSFSEGGANYVHLEVPARVAVTELKVPLSDPPKPPSRSPIPVDPDAGPLRRFSPRKSWPEVAAIDAKLDQLDGRRVAIGERIAHLEQEIREAAVRDKEAVAEWQLGNAKGQRPAATVPALEKDLEQARADLDSYAIAEDRILKEKVEFVSGHRKRLVTHAAKTRALAVKRLQDARDAVEQARAQVLESLASERWAREYPGDAANAGSLQLELMKGGRLSKAVPDVRTLTSALSVLAWLRDDARWLDRAVSAEGEARPLDPHEAAIWEQSREGHEAMALANERLKTYLQPRAVTQAEWEN